MPVKVCMWAPCRFSPPAGRGRDGGALRERIKAFFAARLVEQTFSVAYGRLGEFAALREQLDVIREDYGATMVVTVRGTPETLRSLATRLDSG